jgi:hypothetical protein
MTATVRGVLCSRHVLIIDSHSCGLEAGCHGETKVLL